MPLYKRKPFALVGKPEDLDPEELVFQVRFTKEIFRSYSEYLKRIRLYRKRAWTCKATGRGNLTYEEALISEEKASIRIQTIPTEYLVPILCDVQFSMLNLKDLVNSIAAKLEGPFSEGDELYGRKDGRLHRCKILEVIEDSLETQYEIEWLDDGHKMSGKTLLRGDELTGKNLPFSKRVLKSFIKDSTYRNLPWVLHDNLAKKHGISTSPPEDLRTKCSIQDGLIVCSRKRKKSEESQNMELSQGEIKIYKRRNKLGSEPSLSEKSADQLTFWDKHANENQEGQSIKYPIDDLLVQPSEEDRFLVQRPDPCKDFNVHMDCVGDLLMVWDFCICFGRLLSLSPFSLEDFENSLCFKDSTPPLIVESYAALLRFLIKDSGDFSKALEKKKRKSKITLITWTDYLCDFLETTCNAELLMHISTIKRGHYGLLDVHVKLAIFCELVAQALETNTVKEKMEEYIEERQALAAARRDEALDEGRKRREEKERKKSEATTGKEVTPERSNGKVLPQQTHSSRKSEIDQGDDAPKKISRKQKLDINSSSEDFTNPSKRDIHKLMKSEIKEAIEKKSAEERKEFLEREIEKRIIRTSPAGKDKNYCRYWVFRRDARLFVESSDSKQWGYYKSKEELDALIGSLNTKGVREKALKKQLQKLYDTICLKIQQSSKEAKDRIEMEDAPVRRSTRVRAPPRENPAHSFLKYVNKWKEM